MAPSTTPRVFVSAVSSDLRSARKVINEALNQIECLPVEESIFGTEYGAIREMLRRKIASCQAVLHLVGRDYGGEPDPRTLPPGQQRRSWTQIEYDLAKELGKKLYIIVCDDTFPFDPVATPEAEEKLARQNSHRSAVLSDKHLWHSVSSTDELRQQVENLKVPLDEVREELRRQQFRHRLQMGLAAAAVVMVLMGVVYSLSQLRKKVEDTEGQVAATGKDVRKVGEGVTKLDERVETIPQATAAEVRKLYEDPDVLTGKLKTHIRNRADEQIAETRKTDPKNWQEIDEIEKRREQTLDQVDELVATIRKGLAGDPDPIFAEAARILAEQGPEESLRYLERKQPEIEKRVNTLQSRRNQAEAELREALQPWMLKANLHEMDFQWPAALELREQVVTFAPDWFNARNKLGVLLFDLARYRESERHLRAALALADNADEEAHGLNNLASLLQATNRLAEAEPLKRRALAIDEQSYGHEHPEVAVDLNNLAQLLQATNRLAEAEPLMRRALAIDEQSHGREHPNVAIDLNNLAQLLKDTNRLAEAEPLMRRALAIGEQSFGPGHPKVATALNNLAMLLKVTSRLAEAEPLMRRALALEVRSFGPEHPDVAIDLNNLAMLLEDTNRLAEAEPLMRRALAIGEQSLGPEHPDVAIRLNNLATLLKTTNRLAEAEPLMCRALAIDERSFGPEHPDVAIDLSNLAQLLQATNRLAEAEPLIRRALAMYVQSLGSEHPDVAIDLNNLAQLLMATNRLADAVPLVRRALAIDEQSFGPEHPNVAIDVNNLAQLLQATNRLADAEPLMRRCMVILWKFGQATGHEHPGMQVALENYDGLLIAVNTPADERVRRMEAAMEAPGSLPPIAPEVERLLGPAKPVEDVLSELDRQYKAEGKPAVFFLPSNQAIAPHLVELLKPDADFVNATGLAAYDSGAHAEAVVHYEKALELYVGNGAESQQIFTTRMNRTAALLELGNVQHAHEELQRLLPELEQDPETSVLAKGAVRYHRALCEWRLGDRAAAQREAEESLQAFARVAEEDPVSESFKEEARQLLADIKENKPPPPQIDAAAELQKARERFQAREELATLPLNQSVAGLLDQMLGPAQSTQEVFDELDRQYREQGKPAVWFLPLDEPISPHLDELLGPAPADGKE